MTDTRTTRSEQDAADSDVARICVRLRLREESARRILIELEGHSEGVNELFATATVLERFTAKERDVIVRFLAATAG